MTTPANQTMKIAFSILTIILALATLVIAIIFVSRLTLSYNSQGSYFDENSSTVYYEQAVIIYGLLFSSGLVLTLLTFNKTRKAFYK